MKAKFPDLHYGRESPDKTLMLIEAEFDCGFCGSVNAISVDPSAGVRQEYVEDCQNCCRPHLLSIEIEPDAGIARVDAEPESS